MSWHVIMETFSFIFLASLPGRTTFVMLLMSARSRPLAVFAGSSLAFLIQATIAVCLGSVIGLLPQYLVSLGAGVLFIFFAILAWREKETDLAQTLSINQFTFLTVARQAFVVVFAAEWGDVSQLAIASTAAQHSQHFEVWCSASLALIIIAIFATFIGAHSRKIVHPKMIQYISAIAFGFVGVYFLVNAFQKWI